jgi:hypothetical protein
LGPPGSGSVIVCTDPDPSINKQRNYLLFSDFLMIFFIFEQNGVKVPTESKKKKKLEKNFFLLASWQSLKKRAGSVNQIYGSKDPDPYQDDMDPEHCWIPSLNDGDGTLGS